MIASMQEYDRYSYVGNNPVRYTDPTGRCIEANGNVNMGGYPYGTSGLCSGGTTTQQLSQYGVTTSNGTHAQNQSALQAAQLAGNKIAETIGGGISSQDAFRQAHGNTTINFNANNTSYCETDDNVITCGTGLNLSWSVQTIIHQFGHVFDNQFQDVVDGQFFASSYPENRWDETFEGYKCSDYPCMQHPYPKSGARGRDEDFADMYLNWVLDMNPAFPDNGFTTDEWGNKRRDMMNNTYWDSINDPYPRGMPVWLEMMGLR